MTLAFFGCKNEEEKEIFNITCLPTTLQNGVIAFYPFNNGSLVDDSSNGNDINNPTTAIPSADRNGNASCAYEFKHDQNTDEFLTTTNSNFLNGLDEFSVSIWYQPMDPTIDGGVLEVLLSRGDGVRCPNKNGEWAVSLYDCRRAVFGHNNSVWANLTTTPNSSGCQAEVVALTDKWQHVVAVRSNDSYKIYFNGNLDQAKTGNSNCFTPYVASDIGDLFIGKRYNGKIDDVLIYNRELSQAEVTDLFELGACCQ